MQRMTTLKRRWVDEIFSRLTGIYGAQFRAKYSSIKDGIDVGIEIAKEAWAIELSGFSENPDAIGYALKNLPAERAPNAIEFVKLCRSAPKQCAQALPPPPATERGEEIAREVKASIARPEGYDFKGWARITNKRWLESDKTLTEIQVRLARNALENEWVEK